MQSSKKSNVAGGALSFLGIIPSPTTGVESKHR
jgi:hypothetical protein